MLGTGRTGPAGPDRVAQRANGAGRTGPGERGRANGAGRTGPAEPDRANGTGRTEWPSGRTGRAEPGGPNRANRAGRPSGREPDRDTQAAPTSRDGPTDASRTGTLRYPGAVWLS